MHEQFENCSKRFAQGEMLHGGLFETVHADGGHVFCAKNVSCVCILADVFSGGENCSRTVRATRANPERRAVLELFENLAAEHISYGMH